MKVGQITVARISKLAEVVELIECHSWRCSWQFPVDMGCVGLVKYSACPEDLANALDKLAVAFGFENLRVV